MCGVGDGCVMRGFSWEGVVAFGGVCPKVGWADVVN